MTLSNPAQYISGRTVQEQMNSLIDYVDTRAAEVATDAIASDVAQVHQDMLDADADAAAAAASAAAAAGALANAVKKTGEASQTIQGDVAVTGAFSSGAAYLGGNTSVAGDLSASGDLSVNGDATLSGDTSVTTEATGTFSNRAANSLKLKNELDNYGPMLRTANNQDYDGIKRALKVVVKKASIEGSALPNAYWIDNHVFEVQGNTDNTPIISIGSERGNTGWSTRINLNIFGSIDEDSQRQNSARIIFIFDEVNKQIRMQVGRYDAVNNVTNYNTAQTLYSW